jgi:hypothetical protein
VKESRNQKAIGEISRIFEMLTCILAWMRMSGCVLDVPLQGQKKDTLKLARVPFV